MKDLLKYLAISVSLLLFISCDKGKGTDTNVDISGEWKLAEVNGTPADALLDGEGLDVYLSFSPEGTFESFQKLVGGARYIRYSGTYSIRNDVASGSYSDGTAWAADYTVSVSDDGTSLTMTSGQETCLYSKNSIPSGIRDNSIDSGETKSNAVETVYGSRFL